MVPEPVAGPSADPVVAPEPLWVGVSFDVVLSSPEAPVPSEVVEPAVGMLVVPPVVAAPSPVALPCSDPVVAPDPLCAGVSWLVGFSVADSADSTGEDAISVVARSVAPRAVTDFFMVRVPVMFVR